MADNLKQLTNDPPKSNFLISLLFAGGSILEGNCIMSEALGPLTETLKKRADWHLEKIEQFKSGHNHDFHKYCRKELLQAIGHIDNARMALPTDF